MATSQDTADYLAEQVSHAGAIRTKKMFGEYALYCDDKVVALLCDEQLFVKPTDAGRAFVGDAEEAPPYPGAKMYLLVGEEKWQDTQWLSELIRKTVAALPKPKPKRKKLE